MNFPINLPSHKHLQYPTANIYNKNQNRMNQNNQPISQVVPVQKSFNINPQNNHNNKNIPKPKNNYIHNGINLYENPQQYNNEHINNEINFSNHVNNKNTKPQNKNKKNTSNNNNNNLIDRKKLFSQTLRDYNKRPIFEKKNKTPNTFSNKSHNQSKKINENYKKNRNLKSNPNLNTKKMCVDQLIKNGVNNEIRKYKTNKMTSRQMLVERKKKILEEYGTNIDDISSDENNDNEFSENKKFEKKEHEISGGNIEKLADIGNDEMKINYYKTTRDFYSPKQNNYFFNDEYLNETNSKTMNSNKKYLKPKVNQFEYIKKIKNEQKKLPTYTDNQININSNLNNNNTNENYYFKNKINGGAKKNLKPELNDSFRHKNNIKDKNNVNNKHYTNNHYHNKYNSSNKNELLNYGSDNFSYNDRKNHRSSDEIRRYLCEKKIQNKEEENNKIIEKNKKLLMKYKDLYMLNMKESKNFNNKNNFNNLNSKSANNFYINNINNYFNENYFTKIQSKSPNALKINANRVTNTGNNSHKKRKEINEYYIGGDSTIKNNNNNNTNSNNNNSTLVELNEYYLNVLESQQLVVNSNLNKIHIIPLAEPENGQNNNINNENISLLKSGNLEEIRKKIANTLKRANKLFSKNDSTSTITLNEDKNTNINEINKNNENGKINNENENIKIKKNKIPEINIVASNTEHLDNKIIDTENINSNSNKNTKEKVLSSLSHTFTTNSNNPNKKIEVGIEPRSVLNLVEILKFIIQRKIFVRLYEFYINGALFQQYTIAFAYFVAVCKHYPFKKIEEFCNYKMYNATFRQLFKPFIHKYFNKFIDNLNYSKKIKIFEIVLKKLFKKKILKKLIEYAEFACEIEAQNKLIEQLIKKIMNKLINPHLKIVFNKISNYDKKKFEKKNEPESPLHKRANDFICSNSYLYESLDSSSSNLSIHDINSENNDKLHQFREKIKKLNELYLENNNSNSTKSINDNLNKSFSDFLDENKNIDEDFKKYNNMLKEKENNNNDSIDMEKDLPEDIKELLKHNIKNGKKNNDEEEKKDEILKIKPIKKRTSEDDLNIQDELFLDQELSGRLSDKNLNNKNEKSRNLKLDNIDIDLNEEKIDFLKKESDDLVNIDIIEKNENEEKNENIDDKKENNEKNENKEKKEDIEKKDENIEKNENKEKKENIEKKDENIEKNEDKEKNENIEKKEIKKDEEKKEENIRPEHLEKLNNILSQKIIPKEDFEKFALDLTEDIIAKTLFSEITSIKKKLIPTKKFKYDKFLKMNSHNPLSNSLNNSYGSMGGTHDSFSKDYGLGLSRLSLNDDLSSLNDSIMSSYSFNSYFNRTIKDKKKQNNMNFYLKYVAPKFIKVIKKEIIKNYPRIYDSISTPIHNDSKNIIIAISLQDLELYRESYKNTKNYEKIDKILDVKKIIQNFEPINKKIRKLCPFNTDIIYDNILNECLIETAIELINGERLYGSNGEPLKWSSRTHELKFKYNENDPKKLADYVCQNLVKDLFDKVGLIKDNCDDMSPEQINIERDKRLTGVIKKELENYEKSWNNLEIEETQLKVDSTEVILMQLYNEVIEILEHISFSRIRPDLYQYKSIYACEEIPRLDFQLTTTENSTIDEKGENDAMNI